MLIISLSLLIIFSSLLCFRHADFLFAIIAISLIFCHFH